MVSALVYLIFLQLFFKVVEFDEMGGDKAEISLVLCKGETSVHICLSTFSSSSIWTRLKMSRDPALSYHFKTSAMNNS